MMTVIPAPPHLSEQARRDWDALQAETGDARRFGPGLADLLPAPTRRWVSHAIQPGTPLLRSVLLRMRGHIRLGAWRKFDAVQVRAPMEGFVWSATAWIGPLAVRGFDRYRAGEGEMRWRLLHLLPIMSGTGPDITESAAGRLACELVMAPAAALDPRVRWKPVDDHQVIATVPIGAKEHDVTLCVAPTGALTRVTMKRWGNPDKGTFGRHTFGIECAGEATFDGFTIPSRVRGGWWPGSERWDQGEFIRFDVQEAQFR
ncbi:DUF6544 family protein [[Actinomadura] parvosata]